MQNVCFVHARRSLPLLEQWGWKVPGTRRRLVIGVEVSSDQAEVTKITLCLRGSIRGSIEDKIR